MPNRLRSLQAKLTLAFLGVALVAVGVLGLLVGRASSGAFEEYLMGRRTGDLGAMDRMMDEMMGSRASRAAMEQMFGPAERAYLEAITDSLWIGGLVAALAAVGLGLLFARRISSPLRDLTLAARRLGAGDFEGRVPVSGRRDELGELAEAFNSMAEAVGRQETLRRRMAADIAHELRTPLAVIQANLEAMLDGVRPLSVEEVADVHRETRLLSRLITDLRDLSLAETGQLPLRKGATNLAALARTSVARFASRAKERGVRLAVEIAEDLPRAEVDPHRIDQVLGNLLDNALRHAPPGGEVAVSLKPVAQHDGVSVTVRDTGRGIPEEHLPNVFERFYRADPARSREGGGSGIGLAVVKQLIEAHGGRVWAESIPGKGATFGFSLPTEPGDPNPSRSPRNTVTGGLTG
ncbi:HAMP domain-containing protein (plasmid) [Rubrobacter marinus]|uniref:histidine kinase n=1 Tax=Rubrobacter marinus TaxID=2653852 RepID=A0A6G8Q3G7_9ACTN|nr:ATP-binding protein [Rubrobacter marinus]QIN81012.1 HAMP domain-containing protein [Rubrobacter marinus]